MQNALPKSFTKTEDFLKQRFSIGPHPVRKEKLFSRPLHHYTLKTSVSYLVVKTISHELFLASSLEYFYFQNYLLFFVSLMR